MSVLSVQHQRQELPREPYSFLRLCKFQLLQHLRITKKPTIKSQKKAQDEICDKLLTATVHQLFMDRYQTLYYLTTLGNY